MAVRPRTPGYWVDMNKLAETVAQERHCKDPPYRLVTIDRRCVEPFFWTTQAAWDATMPTDRKSVV